MPYFVALGIVLVRDNYYSSGTRLFSHSADQKPGSSGGGVTVIRDGKRYLAGINTGDEGEELDFNMGIEITEGGELEEALKKALAS